LGYGNRGMKEWAEHVHGVARDAGWHDEQMPKREQIAVYALNIVGEAAELWEAFRRGELDKPCDKAVGMRGAGQKPLTCLEEELADIVIRVFDTAEALGIDIERAVRAKSAYNETRPRRHGGKLA
jgi:NTP pyrophosphatase (non-canonical NTP hydrolase)